jgi:hypothetical protein
MIGCAGVLADELIYENADVAAEEKLGTLSSSRPPIRIVVVSLAALFRVKSAASTLNRAAGEGGLERRLGAAV